MGFWSKFLKVINPFVSATHPDEDEPWVVVRNRDEKGRYKADDESTPGVNEAYVKVRGSGKEKFKDTSPEPGVQNKSVKKPVKKRTSKKSKMTKE